MFEKQGQAQGAPGASAQTSPLADDVIVHVMPKSLYGKEVAPAPLPTPALPAPAPVASVAPAPVPLAPVPPKPVTAPVKRSRLPLIMGLFLLLLLLGGAGVAAYVFYFAPVPVETVPIPTPEPDTTPTPQPEPEEEKPTEPEPGKDTDSDGLTDVEELMYGTDYRDPDTDKDTFLDGNEVFHRYHPNGQAPQTLLDTGAVRILQNTELPFTVYYPSSWTPVISAATSTVTFRSSGTAAIRVSWKEKAPGLSLENWYDDEISTGDSQDLASTYTKEGLYELTSEDGRVAYLDGGEKTYIFTYDLGDESTIEYLQTFAMMVNSFILLP
jgi:hypothetical protein